MEGKELEDFIFKKALSNAYKHNGKAETQAVLRKILFKYPELRPKVRELILKINEVVSKINQLSIEEQYNYLVALYPEELKEEKIQAKALELPPLPNAEKYKLIVTRFAPNPDGPLHLGNIRAALLSHEYARKYKGRFIIRFEDTDPRTKKPILNLFEDEKSDYEYILRDLEWLYIIPDEIYIQSDRLKIYYDIAKEIIKKGGAYLCFCDQEKIKRYRNEGIPCEHREKSVEENLEQFDKSIKGDFLNTKNPPVLRIKTDIKHPNPSVRDWIAFRHINPSIYPHPRIKKIREYLGYDPSFWPTYNFSVSVDDHLMNITHVFRAKEHIVNTVKQSYIYKWMGWNEPESIHYGRINFENVVLSKTRIREMIKEGKLEGYADPDLATILSLRKRGFLPDTIREVILELGVKPVEAKISLENLYSINRKKIDSIANRYFFVYQPQEVYLINDKEIIVKRQLHPSRNEYFELKLKPSNSFIKIYVCKNDLENVKEVRLIEIGNVKIMNENGKIFAKFIDDQSIEYARKNSLNFIQWVYDEFKVNALVKCPSSLSKDKKIFGYAEKEVMNLKIGTLIQFLRFGFVKLDEILSNEILFYYTHN
jgi:glutamyl-tRNA synthetase, archaeal and eukaryotic family